MYMGRRSFSWSDALLLELKTLYIIFLWLVFCWHCKSRPHCRNELIGALFVKTIFTSYNIVYVCHHICQEVINTFLGILRSVIRFILPICFSLRTSSFQKTIIGNRSWSSSSSLSSSVYYELWWYEKFVSMPKYKDFFPTMGKCGKMDSKLGRSRSFGEFMFICLPYPQ